MRADLLHAGLWKHRPDLHACAAALSYAYDSLSYEKAKERLKVKKEYVRRFEKVLPAKKALRFLQMENRMDAVILLDVAKGIPLAE